MKLTMQQIEVEIVLAVTDAIKEYKVNFKNEINKYLKADFNNLYPQINTIPLRILFREHLERSKCLFTEIDGYFKKKITKRHEFFDIKHNIYLDDFLKYNHKLYKAQRTLIATNQSYNYKMFIERKTDMADIFKFVYKDDYKDYFIKVVKKSEEVAIIKELENG